MNRVRQLCVTTLLTVLLAASPVLAGDMPGPGVTSTPPPASMTGQMPFGATSSTGASVTGNMPLGVTSAIDPVTELTLNVLQSLFALF